MSDSNGDRLNDDDGLSVLSTESVRLHNRRLCYIGQDIRRIPPLFFKLYGSKIDALDMSFNCLNNLTHVENFIHLKELILDNNEIGDNVVIPHMSHLCTLSLNNNRITDLENFVHKLKYGTANLNFLSLLGNKACPNQLSDITKDEDDYMRYRYYVLHHIPKLKFLDSSLVSDVERREAVIRGPYMQTKRPKEVEYNDDFSIESQSSFSPLPVSIRSAKDHAGVYGKCSFKYIGAQSEGNRFIMENDL